MREHQHGRWTFWLIFAFVLWALVVAVLGNGYVHPDEFFQSVEVAAKDVLGKRVKLPWEWGGPLLSPTQHASWSRFVPCRSISFAFFAAHLPLSLCRTRSCILVMPRIWAWAWSLCSDLILRRIWDRCGVEVNAAHLAYRTSWTTWTLQTRSLSNAYETFALALALHLSFTNRAVSLGAVVALGCFFRFSFAAYSLPLLVTTPRLHLTVGALLLVATLLIFADSRYFSRFVLTPWNNFRFNSSTQRISAFGLHNRLTHVFNLAFLFGPFPFFSASAATVARRRLTLRATAIAGFLALSTSRHQEARFLLPVAPAVFAIGMRGRKKIAIWILANSIVGCFFSFVHQAGVTRLLLSQRGGCIVFVGCYLAPRSLVAENTTVSDFQLEDLGQFGDFVDNDSCFQSHRLRKLAIAASVPRAKIAAALSARGIVATKRTSFWPHFSGEYLPTSIHDLQLVLYDLDDDDDKTRGRSELR